MSPSRKQVRTSHIEPDYADREYTPLELAVDETWNDAENMKKLLPENETETLTFSPMLTDAVFCGHIMADLDSIAGAIAAANLYGGIPARASEINSETKFALDHWGFEQPKKIEDILAENPDANICLVDFQQQSQLNQSIPMNNIVGIIDHHALQNNTIITEKPIFVDIRPWGCMCSILAHSYAVQQKYLPTAIAGLMLSAILSDTLNLRSPTTTPWDQRMVTMLCQFVEMTNINDFANSQFRAKSHELSLMSPHELVNGDMKKFKFNSANDDGVVYAIGFGVIETTDAQASIDRVDDLIPEMQIVRDDDKMAAFFLAVVDIVNLNSTLIVGGAAEHSLGVAAFGGDVTDCGRYLELKGLVSRKKDFIPAITKAINDGWAPPKEKHRRNRRKSTVILDFNERASGMLIRKFDSMSTIASEDFDETGHSIESEVDALPKKIDPRASWTIDPHKSARNLLDLKKQ